MKELKDFSEFSLFDIHVFSEEDRKEVIENNIMIDLKLLSDVKKKLTDKDTNSIKVNEIENLLKESLILLLGEKEIHEKIENLKNLEIEKLKKRTLLMTILLLDGKCDADCDICYTDRQEAGEESLSINEYKEIIDEIYELGNRTIYIPGEGEPFQFDNIIELIEYSLEKNQNIVLFTNGLLLSDEEKFRNKHGISVNEFLEKYVKDGKVYLYIKYWHPKKEEYLKMLGLDIEKWKNFFTAMEFESYNKSKIRIDLPNILHNILNKPEEEREKFLNKVGIETVIRKDNYAQIFNHIIPFVEKYNLKFYLEYLLHSGRYFNRTDYDITFEQHLEISKYTTNIKRQQCKRGAYTITISKKGTLFYCPTEVYLFERYKNLDKSFYNNYIESVSLYTKKEKRKRIFDLIHNVNNTFFIKTRYSTLFFNCYCEKVILNDLKEKEAKNPSKEFQNE